MQPTKTPVDDPATFFSEIPAIRYQYLALFRIRTGTDHSPELYTRSRACLAAEDPYYSPQQA